MTIGSSYEVFFFSNEKEKICAKPVSEKVKEQLPRPETGPHHTEGRVMLAQCENEMDLCDTGEPNPSHAKRTDD